MDIKDERVDWVRAIRGKELGKANESGFESIKALNKNRVRRFDSGLVSHVVEVLMMFYLYAMTTVLALLLLGIIRLSINSLYWLLLLLMVIPYLWLFLSYIPMKILFVER